jgi:hypothetical protein
MTWLDKQKEILFVSNNTRHIVKEDSGHFIQYDDPQLVIEVVLKEARQWTDSTLGLPVYMGQITVESVWRPINNKTGWYEHELYSMVGL